MSIDKIIHARKLVEFIENDIRLEVIPSNTCPYCGHIGALFVDVILQAGLNYKHVVAPRVNRLFATHPEAGTVNKFKQLIDEKGLSNIINWKNDIKLNRVIRLLDFCVEYNIDCTYELKVFLMNDTNKKLFLQINGIGNKTYDYLLKLMNVDTIAVDRHIFSFLAKAGIESSDYEYSKCVVEFAADFMNISRRSIDYSIWKYMAYNQKGNSPQRQLQF